MTSISLLSKIDHIDRICVLDELMALILTASHIADEQAASARAAAATAAASRPHDAHDAAVAAPDAPRTTTPRAATPPEVTKYLAKCS